jgi:hypothetical protein
MSRYIRPGLNWKGEINEFYSYLASLTAGVLFYKIFGAAI